jgi:hypothetical protein
MPYGSGQRLGETIDPRLMQADFSGFANAGMITGNALAKAGQQIGDSLKLYGDEKKQQVAAEQMAKSMGKAIPEFKEMSNEFLQAMANPDLSHRDKTAMASSIQDSLKMAVLGKSYRDGDRDFDFRERDAANRIGMQQRELEARQLAAQNKAPQGTYMSREEFSALSSSGAPIKGVPTSDGRIFVTDISGNQPGLLGPNVAMINGQPTSIPAAKVNLPAWGSGGGIQNALPQNQGGALPNNFSGNPAPQVQNVSGGRQHQGGGNFTLMDNGGEPFLYNGLTDESVPLSDPRAGQIIAAMEATSGSPDGMPLETTPLAGFNQTAPPTSVDQSGNPMVLPNNGINNAIALNQGTEQAAPAPQIPAGEVKDEYYNFNAVTNTVEAAPLKGSQGEADLENKRKDLELKNIAIEKAKSESDKLKADLKSDIEARGKSKRSDAGRGNFIIDKANEAEKIINQHISDYGVAATTWDVAKSKMWGTPEYSLQQQILPALKDAIALDNLREMKANSPTGASGLGALNAKEGERLENAYGKLDVGGDKKILLSDLKRLKADVFDTVHGSKDEREEALKYGIITKEQNDQVEQMYKEQILGIIPEEGNGVLEKFGVDPRVQKILDGE